MSAIDRAVLAQAVELIGTQHEREREAYRRGYEAGRADASLFNAQLHADEEARQHWAERRLYLMSLSRDTRFCAAAEAKQPWRRTYEENMALAIKAGMRLKAPVPDSRADPGEWDPMGVRPIR